MSTNNLFDAARYYFPGCVLKDGEPLRSLYRFAPDGAKPHKKSGYVVKFPDGAGVIGDFRTGFQEYVPSTDRPPTPADRRQRLQAAQEQIERERKEQADAWRRRAGANQRLWSNAVEIERASPPAKYLGGRGMSHRNLHHALRWVQKLPYYSEDGQQTGSFDAMVAAVTNCQGELVSVHRTYLDPFGYKAPVPIPKKLAPASGKLLGCSIKLGEPQLRDGKQGIGVAEGIETALACLTLFGTPTVSAISAMGMARLDWPPEAERLYVYADNDLSLTGQKAANTLATRAQQAGLSAKVFTPKNKGEDWADVLEAALEKE